MKKFAAILILAAALTAGIGGSLVAVAATKNTPAAEAAKAPIVTEDVCMCGGGGLVFLGSVWEEGHWYCYYGNDGYVTRRPC